MKASFPNHYVKWKQCKVISGVMQNYHGKSQGEKNQGTSVNCKTLCKIHLVEMIKITSVKISLDQLLVIRHGCLKLLVWDLSEYIYIF